MKSAPSLGHPPAGPPSGPLRMPAAKQMGWLAAGLVNWLAAGLVSWLAAGLVGLVGASGAAAEPAASGAPDAAGLFERLDANQDGRVERSEAPAEHAPLFDRLLRKGDANDDGVLTPEELATGLRPSTPPKPIAEPNTGGPPGAEATRLLLLRLDANRDTDLTADEAPAGLRRAFDRLVEVADADDDGDIDRRELIEASPKVHRTAMQVARNQGWDVAAELARVEREQGDDADRFDRQPDLVGMLSDPESASKLFERLDANHDGALARDELPGQGGERLARLFGRADRNQDQRVTREEFLEAAQRAARFAAASGGGDPQMMSEMDAPAGQAPQGRRPFARLDRDGDGALSRQEVGGRFAGAFGAADADGDGALRGAELRAFGRQVARQRGR